MSSIRCIHTLLLLTLVIGVAKSSLNDELLAERILNGYNKQVRPKRNFGEATKVSFYLTLLQVIGVKEKKEEVTSSFYLSLRWHDPRLTWNPEDFDGVSKLRVPPDILWTPDITLHNSNDRNSGASVQANALVNASGTVEWLPAALFRSACKIKVDLFPFDWQNCSLKFESFSYSRHDLQLEAEYDKVVLDEQAYKENGEWILVHCPVKANHNPLDEGYQDVTLYLILQRRPLFYIINVIIPCMLISSLSILVFLLPCASNEKMMLGISVLLGLTVYLLLLAKQVPETSLAIPLIGSYLLFTMLIVTLSIVCSVYVLSCYHSDVNLGPMPGWFRYIFIARLPSFLGMEQPNSERKKLLKATFLEKNNLTKEPKRKKDLTNDCFSSICCNFNSKNDFKTEKNQHKANSLPCLLSDSNYKPRSDKINDLSLRQTSDMFAENDNKSDGFVRTVCKENLKECCLENSKALTCRSNQPRPLHDRGSHDFTSKMLENTSNREISPKLRIKMKSNSNHLDSKEEENSHSISKAKSSASIQTSLMQIENNEAFYLLDSFSSDVATAQYGLTDQNNEEPNQVYHKKKALNCSLKQGDPIMQQISSTCHRRVPALKRESNKCSQIKYNSTESLLSPLSKNEDDPSTIKSFINADSEEILLACNAATFIAQKLKSLDKVAVQKEDWQFAARVLDRFLLIVFLIVFVFGTFGFGVKAMLNFPPKNPFEGGNMKYANCLGP